MSLAEILSTRNLTTDALLRASARLEAHTDDDLALRARRAAHRRAQQNGQYDAAGIAKPRSGRGLSRGQLAAALAGRPLSPRVRAKLRRALAALGVDAAQAAGVLAPATAGEGGR